MQSDEDLAMALTAAVSRLAREISNGQPAGLSVSEMAILADLEDQPGMTPAELAVREAMRPPSVTRHIQALAGRNLIGQGPHASDQRSILLSVTEEGRNVLEQARKTIWLATRIAGLPGADRDILGDVVRVLGSLSG